MTNDGGSGLLVRAEKGSVMLSSVPFDPRTVKLIQALPTRRWRPDTRDWVVPARRDDLRRVLRIVGELEEIGIPVTLQATALSRIRQMRLARVTVCARGFRLSGPFDAERVATWRALPERHYDRVTKTWEVPRVRSAAIAVLQLVADDVDSYAVTDRALRMLTSTAEGRPRADATDPQAVVERGEATRNSPVPHTRYVTRGPIFNANPAKRVWVQGRMAVPVRVGLHRAESSEHG